MEPAVHEISRKDLHKVLDYYIDNKGVQKLMNKGDEAEPEWHDGPKLHDYAIKACAEIVKALDQIDGDRPDW